MGTNYYLHRGVCPTCHRGTEPIHIGKSSAGWVFGLHVYPEEYDVPRILNLDDWKRLFMEEDSVIFDEYDREITAEEMWRVITDRAWPRKEKDDAWYAQNDAVRGPNGLARSKLSRFTIAHGEGTWDLHVGDFS